MDPNLLGIIGVLIALFFMLIGIPIGIAMLLVGILGSYYLRDWSAIETALNTIIWSDIYNYVFSTLPLFILMGELLFTSSITNDLFNLFRKILFRVKGGLGMATVCASAMFAAASGSSIANAATMGVVASNEMKKSGYHQSLISGSVLAGGTLGILIPPSTIFVIYGILAEQSIGKLLIAGIIPGLILCTLYLITIYIWVKLRPNLIIEKEVESTEDYSFSYASIFWISFLFVVVVFGMFFGLFSPTEAAAVGAFLALLITFIKRKFTWKVFMKSLTNTIRTTGFIFAIMLGGSVLNYFMGLSRLPIKIAEIISSLTIHPFVILSLIILMYIILGMFMDSISMIVITMPIVIPIITLLGYDLIWFGVMIVLLVELSMLTPPVGVMSYVLKGAVPELKLPNIFKGVAVITIPLLVMITLIIFVPEITAILTNYMDR